MASEASATAAGLYPRGFSPGTKWRWPLVPARELATLNYGRALKANTRSPGAVPVYGTNGQCGWHNEALTKGPGVILGRKGQGPLGVEWCQSDFWVIDTAYFATTLTPDLDLKYFYHLIKYVGLNHLKDGTSNPTLSRDTFGAQLLPLPPLPEQSAIAQILGALDDKIELNRRMNATLEAMARALFQSWFVDFDPVRAKLDGRPPVGLDEATAAFFPSRFERDGDVLIPRGWRSTCLGDHFEMQRGTTYKSKLKDLPGPFLLGLGSIHRNGGFRDDSLRTYGGESPPHLILRPGDLIVSLKDVTQAADLLGAIARVPPELSEGRLTQDTVKLVDKGTKLSRNYLYWTLRSPQYRDYCRSRATGTTNLGLSREDFFSFRIMVPPPEIQESFDAIAGSIDELFNANRHQSRTLATLRDTLLPKLLSGELSVAAMNNGIPQ